MMVSCLFALPAFFFGPPCWRTLWARSRPCRTNGVATFVPLQPGQRSVAPVKGAGAPRHLVNSAFLLLFVNSTLLALSTFLLVVLGTGEVQHAATTTAAAALSSVPSVPSAWPDFAAQSFYDAHLTYIVAASEADILALRNATASPAFVAPKGRYKPLADNSTLKRRGKGRGKGMGKGKGGRRRRSGRNQTLAGTEGRRRRGNRTATAMDEPSESRTEPPPTAGRAATSQQVEVAAARARAAAERWHNTSAALPLEGGTEPSVDESG